MFIINCIQAMYMYVQPEEKLGRQDLPSKILMGLCLEARGALVSDKAPSKKKKKSSWAQVMAGMLPLWRTTTSKIFLLAFPYLPTLKILLFLFT
jgi:hypothetical protein